MLASLPSPCSPGKWAGHGDTGGTWRLSRVRGISLLTEPGKCWPLSAAGFPVLPQGWGRPGTSPTGHP